MSILIPVTDPSSLDRFLREIDFLHDAVVRELTLVSRSYVEKDGWMFGDSEPADARVIIHSQNMESPVVEIIFEEIYQLKFNPSLPLGAEAEIRVDRVIIYPSGKENEDSVFEARKLSYRILGNEYLGDKLITTTKIPFSGSEKESR